MIRENARYMLYLTFISVEGRDTHHTQDASSTQDVEVKSAAKRGSTS
jgi:hypothetical protein